MKRNRYLQLVLLLFGVAIIGCRKSPPTSLPNQQEPPKADSLVLDSVLYFEEDGSGGLETYAYHFEYDSVYRLTGSTMNGKKSFEVTYNGDRLASITKYDNNEFPYMKVEAPGSLVVAGDSISFDYEVAGFKMRECFVFAGAELRESRYYQYTGDTARDNFSIFYNKYNDEGNVTESVAEFKSGEVPQWTSGEVDNKKNIWRSMPLAVILDTHGSPSYTSVNNITKVIYPNSDVDEYEYTYNNEGYPLTILIKRLGFVTTRFVYTRK